MKRFVLLSSLIVGGSAFGADAPVGCPLQDVVTELRLIREQLSRQPAQDVLTESLRGSGQRVLALQSRIDQLEDELAEEQKRMQELSNSLASAKEEDKPALTDQLRRSTERVGDIAQRRAQAQDKLEAENQRQQRIVSGLTAKTGSK